MGANIYVAIEQRQADGWVNIHAEPRIDWHPAVVTPLCTVSWQDYDLFGLLAGVRARAVGNAIAKDRGLPVDTTEETLDAIAPYSGASLNGGYGGWSHPEPSTPQERALISSGDYETYGFSWVGLEELLAFDYDQVLTNESGQPSTYREELGQMFFRNVDELKKQLPLGEIRLLFCFSG